MSLALFKFICTNGHEFEAPDASGEYGEFVVRGAQSPDPGVLQAVADSVYTEVDALLRRIGAYHGKTEFEQADLLQSVFGVACDPAPDGTLLRVGRRAPCPSCGTREMASWEPISVFSGAAFLVTHAGWQRLAPERKEAIIVEAIRNAGS